MVDYCVHNCRRGYHKGWVAHKGGKKLSSESKAHLCDSPLLVKPTHLHLKSDKQMDISNSDIFNSWIKCSNFQNGSTGSKTAYPDSNNFKIRNFNLKFSIL